MNINIHKYKLFLINNCSWWINLHNDRLHPSYVNLLNALSPNLPLHTATWCFGWICCWNIRHAAASPSSFTFCRMMWSVIGCLMLNNRLTISTNLFHHTLTMGSDWIIPCDELGCSTRQLNISTQYSFLNSSEGSSTHITVQFTSQYLKCS